MSGGGKGGSQTTSVRLPPFVEEAARGNLDRANEAAQIGYVPYYGPEVAAFTPMQEAAFQGTNDAAQAFGMSAPTGTGLPQAQTFAGGVQGYSSAPMYQQALDALKAANPGQFEAIQGMFINPQTGAPPSASAAPGQIPAPPPGYVPGQPNGSGYQGEMGAIGNAGNTGGYGGLRDMVDGGGPGATGGQFQGGGLLSGIGNMMGGPREREGSGMGGGK